LAEQIVLVGPVPPPNGDIAAHVGALARALGAIGAAATVVDPRSRVRLVGALGRAAAAGDIVHIHVSGHNAKSYGLLGACLAATPTMVTLHDARVPDFLEKRGGTACRTIAELLARASAVVAVSPEIAAAVAALGVHADTVSPLVARTLRPGWPPAHVAAAAGAPLLAAAVGSARDAGIPFLVAGFARLASAFSGAVLAVFGAGGDVEVARRLDERGLGDRVLALGELHPQTALGTLAACDAFLQPSLDGNVREARALGRRVVASDAARRPAGTKVFRAGDLDGFVAAVRAALAQPAPAAVTEDGFAALLDIYARLGAKEVAACAASPDA
jgi:glycosyltransferase involved in cell wall biosynthesis